MLEQLTSSQQVASSMFHDVLCIMCNYFNITAIVIKLISTVTSYILDACDTGKTPCKYGPVFALYLYCIESNHVNTVQKRVRIYIAFFLCECSIRIACHYLTALMEYLCSFIIKYRVCSTFGGGFNFAV